MKISIVVPVYQNYGSISITFNQICALFEEHLTNLDYEIIMVNDGSTDDSLNEIKMLAKLSPNVKGISFTRNFGQVPALLAGFKEAGGDAVICVSADLQDPINLMLEMIQAWQNKAEIVICYRRSRKDGIFDGFLSNLAYGIIRLSIPQIPKGGFDYFLMDRKILNFINDGRFSNRFIQGELLWGGHRTSLIPYDRVKRAIGRSQYNFWKKLKFFLDAILDSSYLPIRFISFLGFLVSTLGVFYSGVIAYSWWHGLTPFTGWAPIMIAILLIGGLIMIMLGIIGEYLWRINDNLKQKPGYIIQERV